jgi:hypothetical protein
VSLFLVDDTDGRILSELETLEEAIEMMECLARDPETAGLCLVEFGRGGGSLAGFESSTTLRVLP